MYLAFAVVSCLAWNQAPNQGARAATVAADSLVDRARRGDAGARKLISAAARELVSEANDHALDLPTARRTAKYALAMAAPFASPESVHSSREYTWRPAAVRALYRVLELDSADVWSASELEALSPYPYIWREPRRELAQLRALDARNPELPAQLSITRIRLELEVGSIDSAEAALSRLPETVGASARDHLAAEIAFAVGNGDAGLTKYYAGAEAIRDAADLTEYTRDLSWIALPAELAQWQQLGFEPGARRRWLEAWWTRHDLTDGQPAGSRLTEQCRRWRVALRTYRWDSDGSETLLIPDEGFAVENTLFEGGSVMLLPGLISPQSSINRWHAQSRILDDRGILVMRHGDPIHYKQTLGITSVTEENLGWYVGADTAIVGFSRVTIGSTRYGMVARNGIMGDMSGSCGMDSRFCPHAGFLFAEELVREREIAEHTAFNVETFKAPLRAVVQAYGIPDGGILIVLGVPVASLAPDEAAQPIAREADVRIRVVLGDSAAGTITAAMDTVRSWRLVETPARDQWLGTYFTMPAAPGNWSLTITVSNLTRTKGTVTRTMTIPVVQLGGNQLRLGDPILGRPSAQLDWRHGADVVPLNPTAAWHPDEPATVTYEIGGLIPGHAYQTQLEWWKVTNKTTAPSITFSSTDQATLPQQTVQRELSLQQLEPGDYRLVVRVRDLVNNQEVTRERRVAVRKK